MPLLPVLMRICAQQVGTSNSDTGASLDALMLALLRGAHFLHFLTTVPPALVPMLGGGHAAAEEAGHSGGGAGIADMGGAVAQTQGQQDGGHCGGGGAEAGRAAGTSREEGAGAAGGGPAAGASQLRRQQMRALQQLQGLARWVRCLRLGSGPAPEGACILGITPAHADCQSAICQCHTRPASGLSAH